MDNKKHSGGEVTIIKSLQVLEDYKKVISDNVDIKNPDGSVMQFIVHAITPERFAQINADHQQSKPMKPPLNYDGEGKERKEPDYDKKVAKYERDLSIWNRKLDCWTVLAGWAEPENIELSGKTDAEKVNELFKSIPGVGDLAILTKAILKVSRLRSEDVDVF